MLDNRTMEDIDDPLWIQDEEEEEEVDDFLDQIGKTAVQRRPGRPRKLEKRKNLPNVLTVLENLQT